MSGINLKKRTLRCTDDEWQQLLDAAEKTNLSASKYIVFRPCSEEAISQFSNDISNQIRCILNGVRLLAYDRMNDLYEKLGEEKTNAYLNRAKGNYCGMG